MATPVDNSVPDGCFTIEQIRKYLQGLRLLNCHGEEKLTPNQAINLAISLLEDEQDGIRAVTERGC